jgi:hypothetical protein
MQHRTLVLATILLAGLSLSDVAGADERRGRIVQPRLNGWVVPQAVARPAVVPNTASSVQEGRGNAASVVQTGSGNAAGIRQFGRDNTGAITQVGSSNSACLIQAGRNLDGAIQQVGDNQSNGLLQTRWGSSEIPVEVCAAATTRGDVMAYAPERPERPERARVRARGRGQGEP